MNIYVLENIPSSQKGGQERSLFDVCKGLVQKGHTVTLFYLEPGDLLEKYQQFCSETIQLDAYRLHPRKGITGLQQFWADLHAVPKPSKENSVVYANQYHDTFFAASFSLMYSIPFVCHLRLPPPPELGLQWQLGLHRAHKLIAVSQSTKEEWILRGFSPSKFHVVHNGIDLMQFKEPVKEPASRAINDEGYVISYVGRLVPDKGVEVLIQAFSLLTREIPSVKLKIAGQGSSRFPNYESHLRQLVQSLGLENVIQFLGHISQPQDIFQTSDLVVVPSLWPEPCARTILEAMACETPVLASAVGGNPELLSGEFKDCLFQSGSPEALSKKLIHFLKWRCTTPNLGKQARNYVREHFEVSDMLDKVELILHESILSFSHSNPNQLQNEM